MAHNLANINGGVAMAYQGETPWHQLGQRMTAEQAANLDAVLKAANLDYTVALEPMYLGDRRIVPNRKAVVRDGQAILGTVSNVYQPIQNRDAFGLFEGAMAEFGMTVEAAGALGEGERAWMLFKLPTDIEVVDGDRVNGYGLAVTSHDTSGLLEFRPTPIRVVCQNTLNAALGPVKGRTKGRVFGIQHLGDVAAKITDARQLVVDVIEAMKATGDTFTAMAKRKMTAAEVIAYVESVFPEKANGEISKQLEERRKTVADLVWSGVGAKMAGSSKRGTNAWACYNAVTEYFDHVATGKASEGSARMKANVSAMFGTGADLKLLALQQAERLVAA
jgi:phage/plasmid-like protein (TIGR03299 family)